MRLVEMAQSQTAALAEQGACRWRTSHASMRSCKKLFKTTTLRYVLFANILDLVRVHTDNGNDCKRFDIGCMLSRTDLHIDTFMAGLVFT